jgi:hypothetical protein
MTMGHDDTCLNHFKIANFELPDDVQLPGMVPGTPRVPDLVAGQTASERRTSDDTDLFVWYLLD